MKDYLRIPLSKRLEAFRRNGKTKLGHGWSDELKRWQWVPLHVLNDSGTWGVGTSFKLTGIGTELRWCEDLETYFRVVGPAHDIVKLRHKGWYVDNEQSETCHGIVLQLPGRNGEPIYLYGVSDPWNPGTGMIAWRKSEWATNKEDAARWADRMAEHYAETCRDDDAKQDAEMQTNC